MITLFDTCALIVCLMSVHLFKVNRKDSIFVFIALSTHFIINIINLNFLAEHYYTFIAAIEFALVFLGISIRVNRSILIIFLISMVYNGLSFIEFNTQYSFIYNGYSVVMKALVVSLLFIIYKNGFTNGNNNSHSIGRNADNFSYSRLFYWNT